MPLNTQIVRDGKILPVRWGYWHVNLMFTVTTVEQEPDREYAEGKTFGQLGSIEHEGQTYDCFVEFYAGVYYLDYQTDLCRKGEQTLTAAHRYIDPADGEVFEFLPGDVLRAWRA